MNTTTIETTLKSYLIDTQQSIAKPVCIESSLDSYYSALHCELITITYLPINGKEYCIIADHACI